MNDQELEKACSELQQQTSGAWDYENEPELYGTVVKGLVLKPGKHNKNFHELTVLSAKTGEEVLVRETSVLLSLFKKHNPQVKDQIVIKYFGKVSPMGGGNPYGDFNMQVFPAEGVARVRYQTPPLEGEDSSYGGNGQDSMPDTGEIPFK